MVTVREATAADAAAVCRVHEASIRGLGPEGYDERQVEAWAGDRSPADYDHLGDAGARYDTVALVDTGGETDGERETHTQGEADGEGKADSPGRVVGFGTLVPDSRDYLDDDAGVDPAGAVEAVYVHPDHAGAGVGSLLLSDLEREARDRGLASLGMHASLNAVGFYERHGYERVREVAHEFGGDDCGVTGTVVELWRRLDPV
ncbi:GNAT family N-acetyltransferase [Halobaculum sp. CBA1158]|uniref:GNAT family N-acetyltransferase n=1 Tax=Halobaculum sp. CBA1158 TaxID=2904243 RepID=UPI001F330C10|nr:GNAT family N-acetyltransferase [Halobaculum sp. CBA1158]UIP00864.1 GNAT family N-acetyltransferase [Halobaculum sp. CBA1158]